MTPPGMGNRLGAGSDCRSQLIERFSQSFEVLPGSLRCYVDVDGWVDRHVPELDCETTDDDKLDLVSAENGDHLHRVDSGYGHQRPRTDLSRAPDALARCSFSRTILSEEGSDSRYCSIDLSWSSEGSRCTRSSYPAALTSRWSVARVGSLRPVSYAEIACGVTPRRDASSLWVRSAFKRAIRMIPAARVGAASYLPTIPGAYIKLSVYNNR